MTASLPIVPRPVDITDECEPFLSVEQHIASLRDEDPVRWAELNREWDAFEAPPRTIEGHLSSLPAEQREKLLAEWRDK